MNPFENIICSFKLLKILWKMEHLLQKALLWGKGLKSHTKKSVFLGFAEHDESMDPDQLEASSEAAADLVLYCIEF